MKNLKNVLILLFSLVVITVTTLVAFLGIGDNRYVGINNINLGLDLAGGVSITYKAQEENPTAEQMDGVLAIINNRLSSLGYTEATAVVESGDRIRVEIPGVSDANEAVRQIGKTAMLTFVGVDWSDVQKADFWDEYVDALTEKTLKDLQEQGSSTYTESAVRSSVENYLNTPGRRRREQCDRAAWSGIFCRIGRGLCKAGINQRRNQEVCGRDRKVQRKVYRDSSGSDGCQLPGCQYRNQQR